jgi:3-deoxy-manno-octulosonate cytidylyltransferase (CMP-KDO synthetase)
VTYYKNIQMKVLGIIPARFDSTRFQGKPLVKIGSKTMIQRVYEQAISALCDVVVATDDERIIKEVESFGGKAILTSSSHKSGTDRCFEAWQAYSKLSGKTIDAIINIQGDEPFIDPNAINQLANAIGKQGDGILTLVKKIEVLEDLISQNTPKVVFDKNFKAIYFSRHCIPFLRGKKIEDWLIHHTFYKHIGIYAFTAESLERVYHLSPSSLEMAESLEQLRWIENGLDIYVQLTTHETISVDTPSDLHFLLEKFADRID